MNLGHYKLLTTTRTQSLRWELFELTKPSCAAQVSYLKPHRLTVLSTPVACHIKLSFVGQLQVILKFSNIIVKNHCQISLSNMSNISICAGSHSSHQRVNSSAALKIAKRCLEVCLCPQISDASTVVNRDQTRVINLNHLVINSTKAISTFQHQSSLRG